MSAMASLKNAKPHAPRINRLLTRVVFFHASIAKSKSPVLILLSNDFIWRIRLETYRRMVRDTRFTILFMQLTRLNIMRSHGRNKYEKRGEARYFV